MKLVVDGNSLIYRAYHALKGQDNGTHSHAILGFANMLLAVNKDHRPTEIHVAIDAPPDQNKRLEIYPEYKAHRIRDEEAYLQINKAKAILSWARIPWYEVAGYEADDVIATLVQKIEGQIVVVTGDRDLLQLASRRVGVTKVGKRFYERRVMYDGDVFQSYGLEPCQLKFLTALAGDRSDNIPGVEGIGDVVAKRLLQHYGDIYKLYANLEESPKSRITPRRKDLLRKGKESAFMSLRLATMNDRLAVDPTSHEFKVENIHKAIRETGLGKNLPEDIEKEEEDAW